MIVVIHSSRQLAASRRLLKKHSASSIHRRIKIFKSTLSTQD